MIGVIESVAAIVGMSIGTLIVFLAAARRGSRHDKESK